jgi:hypothetical protein
MKTLMLALAFFALTGFGGHPDRYRPERPHHDGPSHSGPVAPELDAGSGGLALGIVGVALALIRERRRG